MDQPKHVDPKDDPSVAKIISRHDWNARSPRRVMDLKGPITKVVTTWADVDPCFTVDECKQRCRELQERHMGEDRLADIKHHFMIGGDGNIYEGRGWFNIGTTYPSELALADQLSGKSVEIAFLDKHSMKPSEILLKTASDCIAFGLVGRYLQEKLQFYWQSPGKIEYLSVYETNAPGTSNTDNFSDPDPNPYHDKDKLDILRDRNEHPEYNEYL